ncbi:MAG: aspartate kinase, partial [Bradymonadaceae bacterium]
MMAQSSWVVHKFGGTSLADAGRYRRVANILESNRGESTAVVVSAMAGVTNTLVKLVENAGDRDETFRGELRKLRKKHVEAIEELVRGDDGEALEAMLEADLADIEDILHALWLLRGQSEGAMNLISGYGELWSARLLATYLVSEGKPTACLDARDVLVVRPGELGPVVDWEMSRKKLNLWLEDREVDTVVITGYVASTPQGIPTTLGRNGSDFSASIFGACLEAKSISIWTDVDGVMSANPRLVPEAQVLDNLSYHEAMELAYFGAKVVHPSTMTPAVDASIPIFIRNTFNPDHPGTRIHLRSEGDSTIKGFATIEEMALINVEGTGMIGVPGIAHRLFGALRESNVSVVMISQGSSEHSICFVVPSNEAAQAKIAV